MLTVLIPTYNYNSLNLVKELHEQLIKSNISFEIICIDDGSKSKLNKYNQEINFLTCSSFIELKENIGRSAIRNLLSKKAKYKWLLFLDSDVFPTSTNFISNYVKEMEIGNDPIYLGGIAYENDITCSLLRCKMGKKNEEKPVFIRKKKPYKYFFTANFLIKKIIFDTINFNESLLKYGYEDLLFSKELKKNRIDIKHLDNAVYHLGIDENKDFLNKTKAALENLTYLIMCNHILKKDTQISKMFYKLETYKIVSFLAIFHSIFERIADKKSSLFFYNLFRLTYLHKILKNSK
ncbi:hypothetical protein BTO04_06830 [Polaribacter sp. SA4-10]|uniref:glycosyltransferase family 2 protein n=1 Tax=Polaribacter sp. SA4-10 TaxID=754397 RepID=UPI000B3BF821|nr:glycosyltransferase family A protein [Polaribacter sp. SA4-10]ARV06429.1 hypothetical protein BTO04_06830 [Polaribacter sp. SA4-10]